MQPTAHILLPDSQQRRLVFYLAMEEYLARGYQAHHSILAPSACNQQFEQPFFAEPNCDMFFLWQTRPTVIFGRHQDMQTEVNLPWCEANNVEIYRRKSGGGCVYSDEGNLMISFITSSTNPQEVFAQYLTKMASALQGLGLEAVTTSHNDILIGGKKISGNACFALPYATIVHGTMLWKSNLNQLSQAITPSQEKLAKHAVQSVRQRVGNLFDMGISNSAELKQHLLSSFCTSQRMLSSSDVKNIEQLEQSYLNPSFILGK